MKQRRTLGIIGGAALLITAPFSLQWSHKNALLSLDSAEARTGRPLTATRFAGVRPKGIPLRRSRNDGVLRRSAQSLQRWSGSVPPHLYLSTCR